VSQTVAGARTLFGPVSLGCPRSADRVPGAVGLRQKAAAAAVGPDFRDGPPLVPQKKFGRPASRPELSYAPRDFRPPHSLGLRHIMLPTSYHAGNRRAEDGSQPEQPELHRKTIGAYLTKIARLGGYLARTTDPPPGNMVMWRGLSRLTDIELGAVIGAQIVGN
jgi:hypothetical protein